ncbi:MAG: hypothetical protein RMI88_03090 [Nitrososphaerota archaeon]|nr:hypothetical protein [Nitrososphaerota archaeon]
MGHQAVGGFLVFSTLLWILSDEIKWKVKMKRTVLLLTSLVCLTIVYFVPLLYFELTTKIRPGIVEDLPYPFNIGDYFPVFMLIEIPSLPMIGSSLPGSPILLFFTYYIYYLIKRDHKIFLKRVVVISLIPILLIVHFFLTTQKIVPWIAGFHPARYMVFVTIFSSIVLGIILSDIRRKHLYTFLILTILIISLHYIFLPSYELHKMHPVNLSSINEFKLIDELQLSIFGNHFRIGGVKDALFNTISLLKPDYYISRGYYAHGILYLDWQYWFEYTLSSLPHNPSNENTLMHLLDWGSIRYLGLTDSEEGFKIAEEKFRPIGKLGDFTIFENDLAPPISEFLYDGAVLVFADYEGYDVLLRSISISNYSKPAPIIVWAEGRCIDDVPIDVLEKFSVTVLYRYCYRDRVKAFQILEHYVSAGGRLFIETMSSTDESSEMPSPIPVSKTHRAIIEDDWNFKIAEHSLTVSISNNIFSPPMYDGGPWGVSSSNLEYLRDGAEPLLKSNGRVLVAYIRYGYGEVVWSGMNLPYHVLAYQNIAEADFMRRLIMYNVSVEIEPAQMYRDSATSILFKIPSKVKGIIFRERYISNLVFSWKASDSKGELDIFMMGPGFNYIVIKDTYGKVEDIRLVLEDGPLRTSSIILSLSTLFLLVYMSLDHTKKEKRS